MSKPIFDFRAVEMHGDRMWSWSWRWVKRAIDTAAAHGLNGLIFHRNDILDLLVFPQRYFDVDEIWARWPVRYQNIDNNRQYLRAVMRAAADAGVTLFLEVKEISFHDSILLKRPELWRGRAVCASDPFWWEFVEAKLDELLEALPQVGGVIVSPATRETRLTISANECTCERCQAMTRDAWYESLIGAMFRPLDGCGKLLAVRYFSYTRDNQGAVLAAAGRVSERIVISLKNTPHDYYPTFPHNPRIGHVGRHPQWVEFDTWGQFYGLGAFPSIVLADMQDRFRHCRDNGVSGVIALTDWEVISDGSVFDTLNLANLTGFAGLCREPDSSRQANGRVSRCCRAARAVSWNISMIADTSLLLAEYVASDRSAYDWIGHKALRWLWNGGPREAGVRRDAVTQSNAGVQERHRRWPELVDNRIAAFESATRLSRS